MGNRGTEKQNIETHATCNSAENSKNDNFPWVWKWKHEERIKERPRVWINYEKCKIICINVLHSQVCVVYD